MNKNDLRKIIKDKRQTLIQTGAINLLSAQISSNISDSDLFKNSKNIALYYPLNGEIDLRSLLNFNKNFFFPKCINNELYFAKYNGQFKEGCFKIFEPTGDVINPEILDIIYIPCLCANKKYYRLGWGKGFYDRFFKKFNLSAKKIIVCPNCFITDEFIEDDFDFRCDYIVSDIL